MERVRIVERRRADGGLERVGVWSDGSVASEEILDDVLVARERDRSVQEGIETLRWLLSDSAQDVLIH